MHAPYYKDVEVTCICGATFKINATVPGPIRVETCCFCHPAFNENKEVKKVIK
ncbi:50S ribosomal protein L31 [bacterium]|nr:50S ribosomal protein L31 [bacterium]